MCSAFDGVDIVDVGVDVFRIVGVIHYCHLDGHSLLFCLQIDDIVEEVRTVTVNIAHELFQSVLGMEHFLPGLSLFVRAHVGERDSDAGIEVRQLTHTLCDDVVFVNCRGEYRRVWPELLSSSSQVCFSDDLYRIERLSLFVFLLIYFPVTEDL